ncbi:TPA: hypothetical protein REV55_002186 [Staphylococcus pseudintermedius]|nr:hypothetical protein [Staphylococcus pseudintermedius]
MNQSNEKLDDVIDFVNITLDYYSDCYGETDSIEMKAKYELAKSMRDNIVEIITK